MTIYGPACTCPPDTRRLPHLDGCPRYDDDRVWSIEDRAECHTDLAEAGPVSASNQEPTA